MKLRMRVLPIALSLAGLTVGAGLPAAVASPVSQARRAPAARLAKWPGLTSSNWSGYGGTAPAGVKFTLASATWTVPSVKKVTGYSSSWVGIDGFSNNDLIQTGTESDFVNGKHIYRAWWEILPTSETIIPSLTISPGDTMAASVQNTSGNKWVITIADETTGRTFSINQTYTGPGASAEWIEEAPSNAKGVLPLAHYKTTQFYNLFVGANFSGPVEPVLTFPNNAIAMVQNGLQVSTPSKPGGNAFNIAYGKKQPPVPLAKH
jgi:hypothetical protein